MMTSFHNDKAIKRKYVARVRAHANEIVFNVKHPTFGQMGIFEWEECELV